MVSEPTEECPSCGEVGLALPEDRFIDGTRMYECENDDCATRKYRGP